MRVSTTTAPVPSPANQTISAISAEPFREWEEATRIRADELMAEARQLQNEGRGEEAVARADDALCEVLQTPPGYEPGTQYIEFVADRLLHLMDSARADGGLDYLDWAGSAIPW